MTNPQHCGNGARALPEGPRPLNRSRKHQIRQPARGRGLLIKQAPSIKAPNEITAMEPETQNLKPKVL